MSCQEKIIIYQGATWQYTGTMTDGSGTPVNLNHYSFKGSIKENPSDTPIPFSFTILDQNSYPGQFLVYMDAATTLNIPVDPYDAPSRPLTKYLGDMYIIFPDDTEYRFYQFVAYVSPTVTEI